MDRDISRNSELGQKESSVCRPRVFAVEVLEATPERRKEEKRRRKVREYLDENQIEKELMYFRLTNDKAIDPQKQEPPKKDQRRTGLNLGIPVKYLDSEPSKELLTNTKRLVSRFVAGNTQQSDVQSIDFSLKVDISRKILRKAEEIGRLEDYQGKEEGKKGLKFTFANDTAKQLFDRSLGICMTEWKTGHCNGEFFVNLKYREYEDCINFRRYPINVLWKDYTRAFLLITRKIKECGLLMVDLNLRNNGTGKIFLSLRIDDIHRIPDNLIGKIHGQITRISLKHPGNNKKLRNKAITKIRERRKTILMAIALTNLQRRVGEITLFREFKRNLYMKKRWIKLARKLEILSKWQIKNEFLSIAVAYEFEREIYQWKEEIESKKPSKRVLLRNYFERSISVTKKDKIDGMRPECIDKRDLKGEESEMITRVKMDNEMTLKEPFSWQNKQRTVLRSRSTGYLLRLLATSNCTNINN